MAQQSRKFGARIQELRRKKQWKQRDLVAAMEKLGDRSLNTNQLSRYENGGAMPGEQRQEWFAAALDTSVADLLQGPAGEREKGKTPDPFSGTDSARLTQIEEQLAQVQTDLAWLVAREKAAAALAEAQEQRLGRKPPPDQHQGETGS